MKIPNGFVVNDRLCLDDFFIIVIALLIMIVFGFMFVWCLLVLSGVIHG